ncbi:Ig-like domain-containing protein [Candidatus Epulonipiscium viviparus]|uniref:Ig-like domain-containing protein n=1 Tax=Candidatus Epulonipiscium viviparus TaxID=420336 RepID=UPI0027381308|nr:Ig-like domain-containing protein [Candidatus Epulopiscium viviparus]
MNFKKYFKVFGVMAMTVMTASTNAIELKPEATDAEVAAHSFKLISFEAGEPELKITTSKGAAGNVSYEFSDEYVTEGDVSLKVRYEEGSSANVAIARADGTTWDFSDDRMILAYDVTNPSDVSGRLVTTFKYNGGSISYQNYVPANATRTVYCVLNEDQYNIGADTLPSPVGDDGIVIAKGWGGSNFDPSSISSISLRYSLDDVGYYIFDNFRVVKNPLLNPSITYANIVDEFGQYTRAEWDNKIHSEEELLAAAEAERIQNDIWIAESLARTDRSQYGGYKNEDLRQEATGHFYTTKIDDKWTLIDPDGYPFFSTGFGIVRKNGMDTWVSGREYMYDLPEKTSKLGDHYSRLNNTIQPPAGFKSGEGYNHYGANLERKFGDDWLKEWANDAVRRFEAWGITSIGAWAEPSLFFGKGSEHKTPYTAFTWTTNSANGTHVRLYDTVPDAFDPEFAKSARKSIIDQAVKYGIDEDPYCFGLYVDNEYKWGNNMSNNPLVNAIFDDDVANAKSYAKRHFVEVLEEKYGTISALNVAWGSKLASFEELGKPYKGKIAAEDAGMIVGLLADKYYSVIDEILNELLPGTMYLGSRNTEFGTPIEVVKAATKYVDILSFNNYNPDVIRENFKTEEYDMPMMIGEFNFSSQDAGVFGMNGTTVQTQEERAKSYIKYVESALTSGDFVGVHWFQYYDKPILGRSWDGENTSTGFVNGTDQPYEKLVEASRYLYDTMYETMFNHVPMTTIDILNDKINMSVGTTAQLDVKTSPANLQDDINYYTSNAYVAKVDDNGVVTAVTEGEATITARSASDLFVITSANITVGDDRNQRNIEFADVAKESTVAVGNTINLAEYAEFTNVTAGEVEWKSSKKAIATVSSNGVVTAHQPGRVNIVIKDKNGYATDSINLVVK